MNRRAKARGRAVLIRESLLVGIWTFFVAMIVTLVSMAVIVFLPLPAAVLLVLVIVLVGIIFDMVGLAAAAASERPFHAMAAKKLPAASRAISLVRNADVVSSICNDLVGDICGTVGGAATAAIVFRLLANGLVWDQDLINVVMVSLVAALTVGGKSAGKGYALGHANDLVYRVALLLAALARLGQRLRRPLGSGQPPEQRPGGAREVRRVGGRSR